MSRATCSRQKHDRDDSPLAGESGADSRSDRGVTAIEYALLASLIAIVVILAVVVLGGNLNTLYNNVAQHINAANQ